jgi:hypothetical protein
MAIYFDHFPIIHLRANIVISYCPSANLLQSIEQRNILISGDYYFYNFLNSKVKLTEIGMYILESIKGEKQSNANVLPNELEEQRGQLSGFSSYPDLSR